jgi:hypothetical protein
MKPNLCKIHCLGFNPVLLICDTLLINAFTPLAVNGNAYRGTRFREAVPVYLALHWILMKSLWKALIKHLDKIRISYVTISLNFAIKWALDYLVKYHTN